MSVDVQAYKGKFPTLKPSQTALVSNIKFSIPTSGMVEFGGMFKERREKGKSILLKVYPNAVAKV